MLTDRAKVKLWRNAILEHLDDYAKDNGLTKNEAMKLAASALFKKVLSGEGWALKEFGDRVDGKVPQALIGDASEDAIQINTIRRQIVDPRNSDG